MKRPKKWWRRFPETGTRNDPKNASTERKRESEKNQTILWKNSHGNILVMEEYEMAEVDL